MIFIGYNKSSKGFRLHDPKATQCLWGEMWFSMKMTFVRRQNMKVKLTRARNASHYQYWNQREQVVNPEVHEKQQENLTRSQWQRRTPIHFGYEEYADTVHYAMNVSTLKGALESECGERWKQAADAEYSSLMENETWDLVEPPKDVNIVDCRWIFKLKPGSDGKDERYKARLVVRLYTGIWYWL